MELQNISTSISKEKESSIKTTTTESSIKNKILLISIVVMIFIFSVGLIVWVVTNENNGHQDLTFNLEETTDTEEFVAQNKKQETLLNFKDKFDEIDSDIEKFYNILNDESLDDYGSLLIN